MSRAYQVKEASHIQMEVQNKLHLQVEILQDAERRYVAMLEQACKMLVDQIIGSVVVNDGEYYQLKGMESIPCASHNPHRTYISSSACELGIQCPNTLFVQLKAIIPPMRVWQDCLKKDLHWAKEANAKHGFDN
ncbi:Hypothetical predicted protein [Olea europaea subsp. europaea]|uniref:Uncharacterized protein n=1 Tax=Olea europaea subsp. europaea TaxID=158383 RepID=A0A8S0SMV0_OLEEU|nr:Hypothetical predicted protein [Olea europaea subsp. europaea]